MANATTDLVYAPVGSGGRNFNLPVDGGTTLYKGTMISQLTATGMAVPASTASSGPAVGVSTAGIDNAGADGAKRVEVHSDRIFLLDNGSGGNACSEATLLGSPVYAFDDHTVYDNDVGGTLQRAGYFAGMEPDGTASAKVRVYISFAGVIPETRVSLVEDSVTSIDTRVSDAEVVSTSLETRLSSEESLEVAEVASIETRFSTADSTLDARLDIIAIRSLPSSLYDLREVSGGGDVANIAGNGGLLASDTTPVLRGDAAESQEVYWAAGNSDIVAVHYTLPKDFDGSKDVTVDLWVGTDNTNADPANFTVETGWDGGALVVDAAVDAAPAAARHMLTVTILAADVPNAASNLTLMLTPPAHATDGLTLFGYRVNFASTAQG